MKKGRQFDIEKYSKLDAFPVVDEAKVQDMYAEFVVKVGQVGDARLLVMTSLLVADELFEVYSELDAVKDKKAEVTQNTFAASDLELIATRIEGIAEKLEGS